jgi:hypothetical protein
MNPADPCMIPQTLRLCMATFFNAGNLKIIDPESPVQPETHPHTLSAHRFRRAAPGLLFIC